MNSSPKLVPLDQLHFDLANPRYGRRAVEVQSEEQALDMIVSDFLVDDLLSSIAANGFFGGEPLIVESDAAGGYKVLEGNRRLTALLILASDHRAAHQSRRGNLFREKLAANSVVLPPEIPVVVVDDGDSAKQALAYLGTKHIVGARAWDSYAKARWMAEMRRQTDLGMQQIQEMIGDTSGLVDRMLEGYYFVEQLREAGHFEPNQSYIKGRGSNPEFPFSWVYTALSTGGIRKFVDLESQVDAQPNPVKQERLRDAGDLMEMMFGNRHAEKKPVINESRDLSDLAKALLVPAQSARLRDGVDLQTVQEEGKPLAEQLGLLIEEASERLRKANGLVISHSISIVQARELDSPTLGTARSAQELRRKVKEVLDQAEAKAIE